MRTSALLVDTLDTGHPLLPPGKGAPPEKKTRAALEGGIVEGAEIVGQKPLFLAIFRGCGERIRHHCEVGEHAIESAAAKQN